MELRSNENTMNPTPRTYILGSTIALALALAGGALTSHAEDDAESPANGPEWGLRFGMTFLFPK
jgi:hypothetical protein